LALALQRARLGMPEPRNCWNLGDRAVTGLTLETGEASETDRAREIVFRPVRFLPKDQAPAGALAIDLE